MKIKTIVTNTDNVETFDAQVNELLAEGWILGKREVLPGMNYNANNWARRALYAELVLLEEADKLPAEPAEPQLPHPIEALHIIRDACESIPEKDCGDGCPLNEWCKQLRRGGDPTDWVIPGEEAPEV